MLILASNEQSGTFKATTNGDLCRFLRSFCSFLPLASHKKMADNINVSERNTLPVLYNINVSTVILPPRQHYIYICTVYTTTQCKLPECKCSICASGWMKKLHQRKLHRVNHHVCKWTICAYGCRIKHHQRKLQLVTTTICASGMVAPVERRETP